MKKLIGVALALSLLLSGAAVAASTLAGDGGDEAETLLSDLPGVTPGADEKAGDNVAGQDDPGSSQDTVGIAVGECNGASWDDIGGMKPPPEEQTGGADVGLPMPTQGQLEDSSSGTNDSAGNPITSSSTGIVQSVCISQDGMTVCVDPPAPVREPSRDGGGPDGEASEGQEPQMDPNVFETVTSIDDIDPSLCNMVHNITACESDSVAVAKERLAERTGTDAARIEVVDIEMALWSDGSLGVPQPDALYAGVDTPGYQVETPGYLVILSPAEGEHRAGDWFEYHTDLNGNTVLAKETAR